MPRDPFGLHRVLEPAGALPQAAERLDNDFSVPRDDELLIDVDTLNVDAASFRQMLEASDGELPGVAEAVRATVAARGKQHNPVTGSGGMLLGRVAHVGAAVRSRFPFQQGQRIASLVSLTLTPLRLDEVRQVRPRASQLDVRGQAVLFESGCAAALPDDLPERVALAALDVCGAPALVARSLKPGDCAVVLGAGGKSGLLSVTQARAQVGGEGCVVGVERDPDYARALRGLGICDAVVELDARRAPEVRAAVLAETGGREADLCVSCVHVEGAEMAAVLCTRSRGRVIYFAMTTSFTAAALGAEGVSRDVELWIGNGYVEGHAELTLGLLRSHEALRELFEQRYGGDPGG